MLKTKVCNKRSVVSGWLIKVIRKSMTHLVTEAIYKSLNKPDLLKPHKKSYYRFVALKLPILEQMLLGLGVLL